MSIKDFSVVFGRAGPQRAPESRYGSVHPRTSRSIHAHAHSYRAGFECDWGSAVILSGRRSVWPVIAAFFQQHVASWIFQQLYYQSTTTWLVRGSAERKQKILNISICNFKFTLIRIQREAQESQRNRRGCHFCLGSLIFPFLAWNFKKIQKVKTNRFSESISLTAIVYNFLAEHV